MPRERIGAIAVAIRQGERPEDLRPLAAVMQPKGVVERVARLVSQVSHGLDVIFDRVRHLELDPLESRIREIKRNADERSVVGTTPLVTQVDRRPETHAATGQLVVELLNESLYARAANR